MCEPPAQSFHLDTRSWRAVLLACAGTLAPASTCAQGEEARISAVLGAVSRLHPQYSGGGGRSTSLRPMFAIRYGRFRIASSGASAVLSFGGEAAVAGASADLLTTDDVKIGIALRVDEGRRSSSSNLLAGLPDVRRTVRARVYGAIDLTPHWSANASVTQDLLGRQGGALASIDLGYRDHWSPQTQWSISAGVAAADRRYMRTWFGISEPSAAATGMSAYNPGSGLRDVHAGVGLITAFTPQWIGFTSIGVSSLLGEAAKSPLTRDRAGVSLSVGLGYRWKQ